MAGPAQWAKRYNPWLHIFAATVWVGPQVFLFAVAVPAMRTVEDAKERARADAR